MQAALQAATLEYSAINTMVRVQMAVKMVCREKYAINTVIQDVNSAISLTHHRVVNANMDYTAKTVNLIVVLVVYTFRQVRHVEKAMDTVCLDALMVFGAILAKKLVEPVVVKTPATEQMVYVCLLAQNPIMGNSVIQFAMRTVSQIQMSHSKEHVTKRMDCACIAVNVENLEECATKHAVRDAKTSPAGDSMVHVHLDV